MIVLHYIGVFSKPSETFIYDLIRGLEENTEVENYILTHERDLKEERPFPKIRCIPWRKWKVLVHLFCKPFHKSFGVRDQMRAYIESLSPDIIHSHFGQNGTSMNQLLIKSGMEIPQVISCHGTDINSDPHIKESYRQSLFSANERNNVFFTASSQFLKNKMVKLGLDENKIEVVMCSPHPRFFNLCQRDSFSNGAPFSILSVGRLVEVKGHVYLIRALKEVLKNYPNARLTLSGEGPLEADLKNEARSLGIEESVTFTGRIPHEKIPKLMASHHVYVQPSIVTKCKQEEGLSVAVLEALAAGLPVIASRIGGLKELLDQEVGYSVEEKNPEALKDAIIHLIDHEAEISRLGANAGEFASQELLQTRQLEQMRRLYQRLSSGGHS